jgi:hypothetical protein
MLSMVTTGHPRKRRIRVILAIAAAAVVITTLVVVVPMLLPPGPRPLFQLPVACGETWQLSTYPGHDDFDADMYPKQGKAWGRPVFASYAGTVTEAGINGSLGGRTQENPNGPRGRGGGYLVKIDHGGKWQTQYLHLLEQPAVTVGQHVAQGEQIGKVGSTGNSGAAHLHYEQRRNRQKVESFFDGKPSGITHDNAEYTVELKSNNCQAS